MFNNSPSLSLDPSGRELIEKNTQLFDLSVNDMDLHQYLGGYIPPHWHGELELFVLLEGLVTVRIGDQSYELQAGEGCFINTEIIHAVVPKTAAPCLFRSFVFSTDMICGTPERYFTSNTCARCWKMVHPALCFMIPLRTLRIFRNLTVPTMPVSVKTTDMNFRYGMRCPISCFLFCPKCPWIPALLFLRYKTNA